MDKKKYNCIARAYRNGFRAGKERGFMEGFKIANENITRHLEYIVKWRKQIKNDKPLPAICENCLCGKNKTEIKIAGFIIPKKLKKQ